MITLSKWKFVKKNIPMAERYKIKNNLVVLNIKPLNIEKDQFHKLRQNDVCLVTGDGGSLRQDVEQFEQFGIDHDVFCVNRSIAYFQRPVNHWAAVDAEECMWLAENMTDSVIPGTGRIWRHTIGTCPGGFDIFWTVDQAFDNETQRYTWAGNSGYFGILAALGLGYRRIVVAGMPLDTKPHWYQPASAQGPNWVGQTYRTWMEFAAKHPRSYRVRSMSGYSQFILEGVTEQWLTYLKEAAA
jgi:hypothetical protein